jgi:hypothetical protein
MLARVVFNFSIKSMHNLFTYHLMSFCWTVSSYLVQRQRIILPPGVYVI